MIQCTHCKEIFSEDEVTYLMGDDIVQDEEHGGSGDYDQILCGACFDAYFEAKEKETHNC